MTAARIVHLRVTLDEVEPAVMRRVEVPLTIRLDRLHLVLQAAMGWTNSHLYEIRAHDVGWGMPDPDFGDGPRDASEARLADVVEDVGAKSLTYLYDFGDGWEHSVRIERISDAEPGIAYPRLLEAIGRCPPEDVGGPWGYGDFLDALADPNHEDHADKLEWIGGHFDPTNADAEILAEDVRSLAKKWTRKPSSRQRH
ncbi:MAG: plasmid pRiA4b ORF-3 family protein [Acetobacteraceae bacterium]